MNLDWNAVAALSACLTTLCSCFAFPIVVGGTLVALNQLVEMKRATVAQAYSTVLDTLQAPDVREARKILIRIEERDFSKWTDEQVKQAEIACSAYDVVGILLKRRVVDPKMVTGEWSISIIRCWEHALPIISEYRKDRGSSFWNDFEWLYKLAKQHQ